MYTRWTQHLNTDEEKRNFTNEIWSAKRVLERLQQMIDEDEKSLDRSEINPTCYASPNWDYHQAHKNGVRQYIHQVKTFIDLDQQKGPTDNEQPIRSAR